MLGPEYNTTQQGWRSTLTEANNLADLHTLVAENLMTKVHTSIKQWQKENYHKSMMHFKETKEYDDNFKKVCNISTPNMFSSAIYKHSSWV